MDFVKDIESITGRSLTTIDIGGGLSTSYKDPNEPEDFTYSRYRKLLEAKTPELFSGKYRIITEFGRSLLLKAGKSLTRINYIKNWLPDVVQPILLTHLGSNQFIREAYIPILWNHRYSAVDGKSGKVKKSDVLQKYDLAGPLCFQVYLCLNPLSSLADFNNTRPNFQGDFLAHDVELPKVEMGDILVIHDTGGYSMSMYSKYNSITPSAIYGYERLGDGGNFKIRCFKERESPEETLAFWGNAYPRIVN
jgi:diaminopimelate decarboxylase